jgi:Gram-negative bacterial TonB protein C-terminal
MKCQSLCMGLLLPFVPYLLGQDLPQATQVPAPAHAPHALITPEADYPPAGRKRQINGICSVAAIIDVHGVPTEIRVIRCSDRIFAANSIAAVARYRFDPAAMADGTPVAAKITVLVNYHVTEARGIDVQVKYQLRAPTGAVSPAPDSSGTYPFTGRIEAPTLTNFVDDGFGMRALFLPRKGSCDVELTIDTKGKPGNAVVEECESAQLGELARKSLLDSDYKPGRHDGHKVPVRVSIHIEFGGYSSD